MQQNRDRYSDLLVLRSEADFDRYNTFYGYGPSQVLTAILADCQSPYRVIAPDVIAPVGSDEEARTARRPKICILNHALEGLIGGYIMEIFRAEKIGEIESDSKRECRGCGATLKLIRTVHFPDRKEVIRAFECDCGERIWDE